MSRKAVLLVLLFAFAADRALPAAVAERPIRSVVAQLPPPPPVTAGQANADLVFVVGGDNRPTGKGAPLPRLLSTLFEEIGWIHPDLVLWSGDTVYGYCDTRRELEGEFRDFLRFAALARVPLFNVPGNHEIHNGQSCAPDVPPNELCAGACAEEVFRRLFGNLYGSFDFAGAHFIALDTSATSAEDTIGGDQLAWLEADLEKNREARAIFIFCHTEFFGSPLIDPPDDKSHPPVTNREQLHALFRRYPVRAVFSGHEHVFWKEPPERHDGIAYFIAGGAGAPAYASPDRGGFAHYLLVRLSGSSVTYDVVEPGRLSFAASPVARSRRHGAPRETGAPPSRRTLAGTEVRFWAINGNDTPLPLRSLHAEVPAALGPCSALVAETVLHRTDGTAVPIPITITACDPPGAPGTGPQAAGRPRPAAKKHHLVLSLDAPARTSVPILVHRRPE